MTRAAAVAMGAIELDMTDGTRRRAELDADQAMAAMEALRKAKKPRPRGAVWRMTSTNDLKAWSLHLRGRAPEYIASVIGVSEAAVASAIMRVECGRYGEIGDQS